MSDKTLSAVGRVICASSSFNKDSTIVWHAGEPCVLPVKWYRSAKQKIENAADCQIGLQSFQTNATLIDDTWIDFFKEPEVRVGVSLDGTAEMHDNGRLTRSGKGTFDLAMRGIKRLADNGIEFHVICVVTSASLAAPEAMAETLIDTGAASIGLNVEEIEGINQKSSLFDFGSASAYRQFLERFLNTIDRAESSPRVRDVERFHDVLANGMNNKDQRHQENAAGAIISVSVDGSVSTFSPELLGIESTDYSNFKFGNVHQMMDVSEIYLNRAFTRANRDIGYGVRQCKQRCAYYGICGGGSPANKHGEFGRFDVAETRHCELSVKETFETMLARVESMDAAVV